MPIIPLPRATGPLGNAPGPVLDNNRRPTIETSAQQRAVGNLAASSRMPEVNASEMAAPLQALGAVGRALANGGDVLSSLALKQREAETDIQIAEADTALRTKLAEHSAWRTSNPDAETWEEHLSQTMDSGIGELLANPKLTPGARARIALDAQKFKGMAAANLIQDRATYTFRKAGSIYDAKIQDAMNRRDYNAARGYAVEKVSKGYGFDHEVPGLDASIERARKQDEAEKRQTANLARVEAFNTAQNLALSMAGNAGEKEALEALERGDMGTHDPTDKERLRNAIQATAADRRAAALSSLAEGIAGGMIQTEAAIDAAPEAHTSPLIRQKAKEMLKDFRRDKVQEEIETNGVRNAIELRQKVREYDRNTDPTGEKFFRLNLEINSRVDPVNTGELQGPLYQKYVGAKPPERQLRPEIQRNVTKSLDVLFDPSTGVIPWQAKRKDATGKEELVEDPAARQRAIDAQSVIEMKMTDWFKANPEDAQNLPKVKAKLAEILPEGTRAAALEGLQKLFSPKLGAIASDSVRGFNEPLDLQAKLPAGLKPHAQDFIDAARETGLNPRVLAAISALETGGGTSRAFREKLNAMGISDSSGPTAQASVRESIFRQARTLAREDGPYSKAKTLDEIGAIYAPPGASNDFKGTNDGWAENVRAWMSRL